MANYANVEIMPWVPRGMGGFEIILHRLRGIDFISIRGNHLMAMHSRFILYTH
jgi:hypothetical protein